MSHGPPERIAIDPDEHAARHVGRAADGRRFFLTNPFEPASRVGALDGGEFVALYLFDAHGSLVEARIDALGPRATLDEDAAKALVRRRLEELGEVSFERIEVAPFAVERFGTTFGLIPRGPADEDDEWVVEAQPGNSMAFYEPWDSGDYDT
ncbi:MAG: hypothetical protein BGO49_18190 [Planctomycetales bacterium 71-10]|nr:MAG: hypothetical protein BGO49_18190 [Planctomycetales bacterium 71-10]